MKHVAGMGKIRKEGGPGQSTTRLLTRAQGSSRKLLNMMPSWEVESRKKGPGQSPSTQDGMVRSPRFRLTKVDCSLGRDGWMDGWMATWGL